MPSNERPTGPELRSARRHLGMRQEDVAEALHVSPRSISRWENGHTVPRSHLAELLAVLRIPSITDHPGDGGDTPDLADDQIEAALRQASHLQILGELARRIQAAQPPTGTPPPVPQVHLRWPKASAPDQSTEDAAMLDRDTDSPA